jgi:hypothetical protein
MTEHCLYCGDELTIGHRDFGICAWCIKEIEDSQKRIKDYTQPSYFNSDRDEYKEDIEYD